MATAAERIELLRNKAEMSIEELADKINVRAETVRNYEIGYVEPDEEALQRMSEVFQVSSDYILGEDITSVVEESEATRAVYIIDDLQNHKNATDLNHVMKSFYLPYKEFRGMELFGAYVHDSSMENEGIANGDVIIFQKQNVANNGDVVVARINQQKVVVRRYHKTGKVIMLLPDCKNSSFEVISAEVEDENFEIIGKVICSVHSFY